MILFLGTDCPNCKGLKDSIQAGELPKLDVVYLPTGNIPTEGPHAEALAKADYYGVDSVPTLAIESDFHCQLIQGAEAIMLFLCK